MKKSTVEKFEWKDKNYYVQLEVPAGIAAH